MRQTGNDPIGIPVGSNLFHLREAPNGARILYLTASKDEDSLGELITADPWLVADATPLVARLAALMFTYDAAAVEQLVQELRWLAYEHSIDHIVMPLQAASNLAQAMDKIAVGLGLSRDFILAQDETGWPLGSLHAHEIDQLRGWAA